ncbi:MAG: hypothetical protein HQK77_15635 [Desulfobacterales bacterium]|nr:hypothetical protein [Desulfobacterales bacterium]
MKKIRKQQHQIPVLLFKVFLILILSFYSVVHLKSSLYAETVYVFYPTPISPKDLKEELSNACPEIDWSAFARYKDLNAMVKQNSPDAILALSPTINELGGYKIILKGSFKGNIKNAYILVSTDNALNPTNIGSIPIAVYDILGRKSLETFYNQFINPLPKLERVSKMEDLVTLLSLNMVKGMIIQEIYLNYIKERAARDFIVTPIPKMEIDGISLAIKEGANSEKIEKAIQGLIHHKVNFLEVDQWN